MRVLLVLAGATLLAACSRSQEAQVTGVQDDLIVSLSVTPSDFRVGDPVVVRLTAINGDTRKRVITTNVCPVPLVVTTEAGDVVGPAERACSAIATNEELGPGEQFTLDVRWSGDAASAASAAGTIRVLPPGQYFLQARLAHDQGIAMSPQVAVRILP